MSTLYNNKYRISSARADWWDYSNAGFYFITLCTKKRLPYFGKILNGDHQLSEIGNMVRDEWLKTPGIRPDMNLVLGEFVVMPDHFHAIIGIGVNRYNHLDIIQTDNTDDRGITGGGVITGGRDAMHRVSTDGITTSSPDTDGITTSAIIKTPDTVTIPTTSIDKIKTCDEILNTASITTKNRFGPQSKNLASIVRGFKSAVTQRARLVHADFAWQPRFHDHIIRDDNEFQKISAYIQRNPGAWRKNR